MALHGVQRTKNKNHFLFVLIMLAALYKCSPPVLLSHVFVVPSSLNEK